MIQLLIIADDFTGALDTGVKFAHGGAKVRVVVGDTYEFEKADSETDVLVMDVETRHLTGGDAYETVFRLVKKAKEANIPYIYKKTDSALRGNIGSELSAVLKATGKPILHFIPAFPKMGRTTSQGIHYIEGTPVSDSVFGRDPFEPVICSDVVSLIESQSDLAVKSITKKKILEEAEQPVIAVYDVTTDEELKELAADLKEKGELSVMAGCAGLAEMLPELLGLTEEPPAESLVSQSLLVVCGSVNPITKRQLQVAEDFGFSHFRLTPEEKLKPGYFLTPMGKKRISELAEAIKNQTFCILDTNDPGEQTDTEEYAIEHHISREDMRKQISGTLGYLVSQLIRYGVEATLLITGGDTLLGFMEQVQVREMVPVEELMPGTVLSRFRIEGKEYEVISKSGGFGDETLLLELAKMIRTEYKEMNVC